jgi:2-polyprenyl-3-methyl-5-hydroxy-6-metoxy-1,4-benzoquinol methylase
MAHVSARRVIDLYERRASEWDLDRTKALSEKAWLDRFAALLRPGASVLDMGCGSGEPIASYLVQQGFAVTGVDAARNMIEMCRSRFPAHEWRVDDMRQLHLGRTFDGLIAWDSTFHLTPEDQEAMFPIFARHARAGAALMFTSGPDHGEAIGSWRGEELYHASLSAAEYRTALAENGFEIIDHVVEDESCGGRTVWLAQAALR